MIKRFSDLGIKVQDEGKIFNCQTVSITDILNCEIEVIDFQKNVKTSHGEGRYLIHYRTVSEQEEGKFFTNSQALKNVLDQVSPDDMPFITVIKATKCGKGKLFRFT